jgi:GNAT superfamily N-acetyltransferase
MRPALRLRKKLDTVLMCMGGPLAEIRPDLRDGLRVEEMDLRDGGDIERWLLVYNDAFGRDADIAEYRSGVVEHPHYDIRRARLLIDESGPVGCTCLGVYRRNPEVGVGHYIAVVERAKGRGYGQIVSNMQLEALFEQGTGRAEAETPISRRASIFLQFNCGWEPKYRLDDWNTPDTSSAAARAVANVRMKRLHRAWAARHTAS